MDERALNLLVKLAIAALVVLAMVAGRVVLVPLGYSLLLALVLYPMVARMERRGMPSWAAISVALLSVGVLFSGLVLLLSHQLNGFLHELPAITGDAQGGLAAFLEWMEDRVRKVAGIDADLWERLGASVSGRTVPLLTAAFNALFGMVFNLFIIPVFTALLLFHRRTYLSVLQRMASPAWRDRLTGLVHRAVGTYARFVLGMVQVYLIVGALNSAGFLLLGVPNAVLFGMLTAVMTMIPYVGITVSALLPISLAYTTTGDLWMPLGVVLVLAVVQYLEANLIFPKVVGRQLGLGTMASLLAIFVGGLIWGVAGIILFLPMVGIVQLIAREVPSWEPIADLLSDRRPRA